MESRSAAKDSKFGLRDFDALEVRFGQAIDALREIKKKMRAQPFVASEAAKAVAQWTEERCDAALVSLGEQP